MRPQAVGGSRLKARQSNLNDECMSKAKKNGAFHSFVRMVKANGFVDVLTGMGLVSLEIQGEERVLQKPALLAAAQ